MQWVDMMGSLISTVLKGLYKLFISKNIEIYSRLEETFIIEYCLCNVKEIYLTKLNYNSRNSVFLYRV